MITGIVIVIAVRAVRRLIQACRLASAILAGEGGFIGGMVARSTAAAVYGAIRD